MIVSSFIKTFQITLIDFLFLTFFRNRPKKIAFKLTIVIKF